MNKDAPFFSIVTVTYNDVWLLSKTIQSVLSQKCDDFEYVIFDGESKDETAELVEFWRRSYKGNITIRYIRARDEGVYDAMNKSVHNCNGRYICFMNSGDRFNASDDLLFVKQVLTDQKNSDGLIGWGRVGQEVWSSWLSDSDAYLLSGFGLCHQSVYLKKDVLIETPFDTRKSKTDSDSVQFGKICDKKKIVFVDRILARRSEAPGISSDLERTKSSVLETIKENYSDLSPEEAEIVVGFKRDGSRVNEILKILQQKEGRTKEHIALMILDVLCVKPLRRLTAEACRSLVQAAVQSISTVAPSIEHQEELFRKIVATSRRKGEIYSSFKHAKQVISQNNKKIESSLRSKATDGASSKVEAGIDSSEFVVSLTSFPARFEGLHLTLHTIFDQTVRPKRVLLYLAESEVIKPEYIPSNIRAYEKHGLEIIILKDNMFQYNKYAYCREINKKAPVITIDDDVLYPPRMIEKLLQFSKKHPLSVIANRAHRMAVVDGVVRPYTEWPKEIVDTTPSHLTFATGVGGVLYPRNFISDYAVDRRRIMKCAPYADDVWLKVVALKSNIKVLTTDLEKECRWYMGYTAATMEGALQSVNVHLGLNDMQICRSLALLEEEGVNLSRLFDEDNRVEKQRLARVSG